ncbi:MAG TPA: ribonuclease HII [Candidatus Cloacimonadota bacterium]|nr:ribonuclease HII [Candidatus Cloacimonadota bacterium]
MKNKHLFDNDLFLKKEYSCLAGTDEAGRGPLAGPVVCASVILPDTFYHEDLNDSKKVSEQKRNNLFDIIKKEAIDYSIVIIEPEEIDKINILNATLKGIQQSLTNLEHLPDLALIDGNVSPKNMQINHMCVKSGDAKHACIAAASILAKVTRDNIMTEYDSIYPQYGFAKHKGYPVASHLKALEEHGQCFIHRTTYKPVKEIIERMGTIENN